MVCDEVDTSLIVNKPHKRRIPSYITNEDKNSADKAELIKRLKTTFNQHSSTTSPNDEESDGATHPIALTNTSVAASVDGGQPSESDIEEKEPEVMEEDAEQELGNY